MARAGGTDEIEPSALVQQVEKEGYNSPRRERILQWQSQQEFPICPSPDEPDGCNVYNELQFPVEVYESIGEFREEKA